MLAAADRRLTRCRGQVNCCKTALCRAVVLHSAAFQSHLHASGKVLRPGAGSRHSAAASYFACKVSTQSEIPDRAHVRFLPPKTDSRIDVYVRNNLRSENR